MAVMMVMVAVVIPTGSLLSSHVVLTFKCSSGSQLISKLKTSLSADFLTCAAQIVVEFDGVDAGGDGDGKSVKKLSKKLKNCQKSKNLKGLKSCKDHQFGKTFIEAPIFY